jgi:hypothetical protein
MKGLRERVVFAVLLGVIAPVVVYNPVAVYAEEDDDGGSGPGPNPDCDSPDYGGGGCGGSEPPTDEEIAQGNKAEAEVKGVVANGIMAIKEASGAESAGEAQKNTDIEGDEQGNSPEAGDPVLVSSGRYEFGTTDIELPGSGYAVKRK